MSEDDVSITNILEAVVDDKFYQNIMNRSSSYIAQVSRWCFNPNFVDRSSNYSQFCSTYNVHVRWNAQ